MAKNVSDTLERWAFLWEQLYLEYFRRLCGLARLRLTNGNTAEAEDVVSEAFMRAIRYAPNPKTIAHPFGYLWRIVRRAWSDKMRKENAANMINLEELESDRHPTVPPEAIRHLENGEYRRTLAAKQGPLTPREAQLLKLFLAGYECDEIAAFLKEDVGATRHDLNAVRNKVRYRLTSGKAKTRGSGQP